MKKRIFSLFVVLLFVFSLLPATSLAASSTTTEGHPAYQITISDPETGESWEWDIDESERAVTGKRSVSNTITKDGERIEMVSLEVDATEYLLETLPNSAKPEVSVTNTDGVTIRTGFTYSVDIKRNLVRMYKTTGATTSKGIYYASNRFTSWRNPGAGVGGYRRPSTSTWSYTIDSTAGAYFANNPPYTLAECKVNISGMSASRYISVTCWLTNVLV